MSRPKLARLAREQATAWLLGLHRKVVTKATGQSIVSKTCQVPDIRSLYAAHGLRMDAGTFVEIGGFDGESFSNTSFLADQGWRGLYIEPIPRLCRLLHLRHRLNTIAIECAAVADSQGSITLHDMGALSTAHAATREAYDEISWARKSAAKAVEIQVRTDTLQAILARHSIPHDLELMVLDIEGGEEPVAEALLASRWRPRLFIVELNDLHPDFAQFSDLQQSSRRTRSRILGAGYVQCYADAINSVFVRSSST